jgi:talin
LNDLANAAKGVRDALNNLLNKVQEGAPNDRNVGPYDDACDDILNATDRMFNSMGNAGEMVKQAKVLAQVCCSPYHIVYVKT